MYKHLKNIKFLIPILLFMLAMTANAQEKKEKEISPTKHKKLAIKYERYGDVYSAIEHYEAFLEIYSNYPNSKLYYTYKLAELYRRVRDYENAKKWYKITYLNNEKKYPLARYYYAEMLKNTGFYETSTEEYLKFKKVYKKGKNKSFYRKVIRIETAGNDIAPTLIDSPLNVEIFHLDTSINKPHIELSPYFLDGSTFYFASLHSDSVIVMEDGNKESIPHTKFYMASKTNDELKWKGNGKVPYNFNDFDLNVGNGAFNPERNKFYFTVCDKNEKGKNICALFLTTKENGIWNKPEKLGSDINLPNYTSTHPTVGIDPRKNYEVLYFVSDRPDGKGGFDIWYTIYDSKKEVYSEVKNAGGKINTIRDDVTPFYDIDNMKLYYSSNGLPGIGGFDIYKTYGQLKKWEEPENIGYPINSSVDDLYYVINPTDKSQGLFVSNRSGGQVLESVTCCDDIYYFEYQNFIYLGVEGNVYEIPEDDSLQYIENILSEDDKESLDKINIEGAEISISLVDSNELILIKTVVSDKNGNYFFALEQDKEYLLVATKSGYLSKQRKVSTKGRYLSDTITKNIKMSPIPKKPIIVKNIYYPFDEYYLTDSAKNIIDTTIFKLLSDNPYIIAEISSHTDSKGTDEYNIELSENRAKSVVNYLISKGIAQDKLKYKGYGEKYPIAPNTNSDGSDNPIGRQKNRRTEFRVIGITEQFSEIIYEE